MKTCISHPDSLTVQAQVQIWWGSGSGLVKFYYLFIGPIVYGICAMPFVPIVDGNFLTESPDKILQTGNFKQTEVLLGANQDEGSYFLIYFLTHLFKLQENVS